MLFTFAAPAFADGPWGVTVVNADLTPNGGSITLQATGPNVYDLYDMDALVYTTGDYDWTVFSSLPFQWTFNFSWNLPVGTAVYFDSWLGGYSCDAGGCEWDLLYMSPIWRYFIKEIQHASQFRFNFNITPEELLPKEERIVVEIYIVEDNGKLTGPIRELRRTYKEPPSAHLDSGKCYLVTTWTEKDGEEAQGMACIKKGAEGSQDIWFPMEQNVFPWGESFPAK